ncbi:MAG: EAL domain-containing protein [Magnetococcus sp. DMHC-6]
MPASSSESNLTSQAGGLFGGREIHHLEQSVHEHDGRLYAMFDSLKLVSRFQSVFSSTHQRGVGFEAFLRGKNPADDSLIPGSQLFSRLSTTEDLVRLDRMRLMLHIKNFISANIPDRWLFMNIHSKALLGKIEPDVAFLEQLLEHEGLPPYRIVVALREHSIECKPFIVRTIEKLRELGCLILFDDFRAESANLDIIWRHHPDIVKLDRSFIEDALKCGRAKRMLYKLISLIHASGSLVLMEKIETEEESFIAMRLESDLFQGRFWGNFETRPVVYRITGEDRGSIVDEAFQGIRKRCGQEVLRDTRIHNMEMSYSTNEFIQCAWNYADGMPLQEAAAALLQVPRVERVYLLDKLGTQIGPNVLPADKINTLDLRYKPLLDTRGATWTRRSLYVDAMRNPGVVQLSRPYRSAMNLNLCTTMSMTFQYDGVTYILCCDILWQDDMIL